MSRAGVARQRRRVDAFRTASIRPRAPLHAGRRGLRAHERAGFARASTHIIAARLIAALVSVAAHARGRAADHGALGKHRRPSIRALRRTPRDRAGRRRRRRLVRPPRSGRARTAIPSVASRPRCGGRRPVSHGRRPAHHARCARPLEWLASYVQNARNECRVQVAAVRRGEGAPFRSAHRAVSADQRPRWVSRYPARAPFRGSIAPQPHRAHRLAQLCEPLSKASGGALAPCRGN